MIAAIVYILCFLTSLLCAIALLLQFRRTGTRLLLASGFCFVGLALNNFLLFVDRIVVSTIDLSVWRILPALAGVGFLLHGIIKEDV